MSERWSFVSEYIYCNDCAKAVHKVMQEMYGVGPDELTDNYRCWDKLGEHGSIVVGFGGGLCVQDSKDWMNELIAKVTKKACHRIRFAALYDNEGQELFNAAP